MHEYLHTSCPSDYLLAINISIIYYINFLALQMLNAYCWDLYIAASSSYNYLLYFWVYCFRFLGICHVFFHTVILRNLLFVYSFALKYYYYSANFLHELSSCACDQLDIEGLFWEISCMVTQTLHIYSEEIFFNFVRVSPCFTHAVRCNRKTSSC